MNKGKLLQNKWFLGIITYGAIWFMMIILGFINPGLDGEISVLVGALWIGQIYTYKTGDLMGKKLRWYASMISSGIFLLVIFSMFFYSQIGKESNNIPYSSLWYFFGAMIFVEIVNIVLKYWLLSIGGKLQKWTEEKQKLKKIAK